MSLYLYILKCSDNSYYTGVTNDLEKRIIQHQTGLKKKIAIHFIRDLLI